MIFYFDCCHIAMTADRLVKNLLSVKFVRYKCEIPKSRDFSFICQTLIVKRQNNLKVIPTNFCCCHCRLHIQEKRVIFNNNHVARQQRRFRSSHHHLFARGSSLPSRVRFQSDQSSRFNLRCSERRRYGRLCDPT